jgi:hypothetical protein
MGTERNIPYTVGTLLPFLVPEIYPKKSYYSIKLGSVFIYIENVQLKVTKSNVFSVDLVTFACRLA